MEKKGNLIKILIKTLGFKSNQLKKIVQHLSVYTNYYYDIINAL